MFPTIHGIAAAAAGGGSYAANGVNFDGTNDYLLRGADLTGSADSKKGIIFFRYNLTPGTDGDRMAFYDNTGFQGRLERTSGDIWVFKLRFGGSTHLDFSSLGSITADGNWHSFLASWDMASAGSLRLFIDDADDTDENKFEDNLIEYTVAEHRISGRTDGSSLIKACVADYYFNQAEFLDLTVTANRRKFTDASNNPVDLGSDGSTPTGTAPIIFFSGATASWHTNKGSGGGFTENGALTDCGTDP